MSLTSDGHFVVDEEGKFMHVASAVTGATTMEALENGPLMAEVGPEGPVALERKPPRRLSEKSAPRARTCGTMDADVLQMRLSHGVQFANEMSRYLEVDSGAANTVVDTLAEMDEIHGRLEGRLKAIGDADEGSTKSKCEMAAGEDLFLQTKTYSLQEIRQDPTVWKDSMKSEFECLLRNGAIRVVTDDQSMEMMEVARQQGKSVEVIPSKTVFTRKSEEDKDSSMRELYE